MIQDLLWAFRWLRKNPLFAVSVTAIVALGVGANTAVFSIVDAVLLRPLPYESPSLARIEESSAQRIMNGVPVQDYLLWRTRADLFEKTIPFAKDFVTVTGAGDPAQVAALRTAGSLFPLLGAHARLGRTLVDSDDEFKAQDVVILSDRFWRRQFLADRAVIGRSLNIAGTLYTVTGVMPPDFEFSDSNVDLWTPLRLTSASTGNIQVVARIKNGVSIASVQSAMQAVAQQLAASDPQKKAGLRISVTPWRDTLQRQYELTLILILIAVGLVLLIACADVGGLLLSRAVQRRKEIAIRISLGAGSWRVMRQLVAESLLLSLAGSALGILIAHYALMFLARQVTALPIAIPHLQQVSLNGRVLLFNACLCLLLACIFSVAPALFASKTELLLALRSGQTAGGSHRSARLYSFLIASEAALAFILLVGSGLMIRSLIRLQQADHGFHPGHVLTMRVPLGTRTQPRPGGQYDTKPRQMAYYRELIDRLQGTPGVTAVAVVNNLPLSGVNTTTAVGGADGLPMLTVTRTISPMYFSAMGIPLIAGHAFKDDDRSTSPQVAIVNEYLARQLFQDRSPLGQLLPSTESNAPPVTIVGVVKDSTQNDYEQPAKGEVYRPYQQFIFGAFMSTIVARTPGDPLALAGTLSKLVWSVDPNQPVVKVETMDDVIADSIWRPRFSAWLFSLLGGLALLLTSVGVYSVIAYTTALRSREVGIRVALGATPRNVMTVILRDAMRPLIAGLAISVIATYFLSRLVSSVLYETANTDPIAYIAAGALLLAIGAVASARPAWKAATADPLPALRSE